MNELMKEFAADNSLRNRMKDMAKLVPRMLKETNEMPKERKQRISKIRTLDENTIIGEAKKFLSERFKADVMAFNEEDEERYDPRRRAQAAMPYRPAIYIE